MASNWAEFTRQMSRCLYVVVFLLKKKNLLASPFCLFCSVDAFGGTQVLVIVCVLFGDFLVYFFLVDVLQVANRRELKINELEGKLVRVVQECL